MKSYNLVFVVIGLLLLTPITHAQNKKNFGVSLDLYQTQLKNINKEKFNGYGHSVPGFTQSDLLGFGVNGFIRIPLYKRISTETGLGIQSYHSQLHFDYFHGFLSRHINETMDINLNYLRLPLQLNYSIDLSNRSSIIFSAGIDIRFLIYAKDNFNDIVFEEILLPKVYQRYHSLLSAYQGQLAYQYRLNNKNGIEIGLKYSQDMNSIVMPSGFNFGIYSNMSTARYNQFGISMKYIFSR